MGKVVSVTNAKNEVMTYEYDAFDNLTKSHDPAGNEIVLTYDRHGRKRTLDDPDLGKWNYEYNGFGELVSQTDAKGQTSALLYDAIGRLIERSDYLADGSLETRTVWTYDSLGGSTYKGFLFQVRQTDSSGNEIVKRTYQPDNIGNVASESIYVEGGLQGATSRTFDSSNRVNTMTYPSGLVVKHRYNSYGALYELRDSTDTGYRFWNASSWDALGQINQSQLGNGLTTSITRDQAVGIEKEIQVGSGSIQKWTYDWDANGNITSRTNGIAAITYTETASYDALDRVDTMLLTTSVGSSSKQTTYDAIGNIQSYPDSGTYTYDTAKRPHAVTATTAGSRAYSYDANGNMRWGDAAGGRRNYTWATFNLPTQVTQGSASAQFLYGPEREKVRQISSSPFIPGRTSYYLDAVAEKHVTASGTEYRELIVSPTGVIAQSSFYPSTGIRNTLYVHTDNLGSIDAVTNESAQNLALINAHPGFGYDQWGNRRDDSGNGSPSSMEFAILKGYTGHDMLDTVNLIHMKGRVYDPAIGRFLSPDPIIQDPNNLQAYNRYGYVSNNPLTNTDPTGYSWLSKTFKKAAKWVGDNWRVLATIAITVAAPYALYGQSMAQLSFGKALITGALGGFAGGLVTGHGDLKAALIGAAVGAAFAGVGQTVGKGATWSKPVPMLKKVVAHGLVGGLTSVGQGGRFGQGFLSSGTSAFFSPAFDKATGPLTGTAIAAVIGGTVSEIGGGKFANGAVTSAAGYAFNSLASLLDEVTPAPGEGVPADIQPEVELLNGAAAAAARTVDSMPGWRPAWLRGIMIHYQFKLNILALAAEGLPVGEVSYKGRVVVPYGKLGSVRPDAVWGSPLSPKFAFELKTGGAYMSKGDLGRYTDNLPAGTRIIESGGF
ncbi:RHS repeat domain-containing protein [Hydrocarboniphaga effusa]|uniref:RHS repeat domain-containing protein n=1 Tax=Hydrocarboniphaga effusa TaxID=243629 RepID=UPI0035B4D7D8